jgi:hypothetical protein
MTPHLRLIELEPDTDFPSVILDFDDNFQYTDIFTHYDYIALLVTATTSENDLTIIANWGNEDDDTSTDESKITKSSHFQWTYR